MDKVLSDEVFVIRTDTTFEREEGCEEEVRSFTGESARQSLFLTVDVNIALVIDRLVVHLYV